MAFTGNGKATRPRPAGKPGTCFLPRTEEGAHWQKLEPRAVEDGLAGGRAPPPVASRMPLFACPIRRPRPFKAFRFCARLAGGRK
jgi:hypothetical protein